MSGFMRVRLRLTVKQFQFHTSDRNHLMADFVASDIVKHFDTAAGKLQILDGVSLEMNRGDQLAILGESGSGKSTFLHIAGTLDQPDSGSITLMDDVVTDLAQEKLPAFRNEKIGFIFQQHNLLDFLSARQNVELLFQLQPSVSDREASQRAQDMLTSVGLGDRLDYHPSRLSGGQKQRVAIARALALGPNLILADEPTAALDSKSGREVVSLLHNLARERGCPVLMVTHDNRVLDIADRIVNIEDGRIET